MAKSLPIASCSAALFYVLFAATARAQDYRSQAPSGGESQQLNRDRPALKPIVLADLPRIDPAGIGGSLVVSGADLPQEALDAFFHLAQGKSAKVVMLSLDQNEATKSVNNRLLERWNSSDSAELQFVRMSSDDRIASADWAKLLADADGVWIAGSQAERFQALAKNDAARRFAG